MKARMSKLLVPALLAATIPAAAALAQGQSQSQPEPKQNRERPDRPRLSPDALKRLQEGRQEGRIAEMKEALKLTDAQLKLWAPVEQQIRASFGARQQARQEFEQRRQQGATPPSLTERLDQASQRMTQRAQRMQAFAAAFKPFYEALSEEQKSVAGIVLRDMRGDMRGTGRRWAMEHHMRRDPGARGAPGAEQQPR